MRAQWTRKFFIVHEDSITSHEDHMKTSKIESAVKLSEGMVTIEERDNCIIAIMRDGVDVMVLRAEESDECQTWLSAIRTAIASLSQETESALTTIVTREPTCLLEATLDVRSEKQRGATWDKNYFTLTSTTLKRYEDSTAKQEARPTETFRISTQCCVFETNLAAHAFEIVTSKKVLHLAGQSSEESEVWIRTLRRVITESQVIQGPLLDRVFERWGNHVDGRIHDLPDFYEVKSTCPNRDFCISLF